MKIENTNYILLIISEKYTLIKNIGIKKRLSENLFEKLIERRGWDSNPRTLADTLVFKTRALNHSTTPPKGLFNFIHQLL